MNDDELKMIDHLISEGALEPAGMSETGEPLYNFTNKLQHVMPALYREHLNYVNAELMGLWEKGFIIMDLFDENPTVRLADKAFDKKEIAKLSDKDQFSIKELKRILLK